MWLGLHVCLGLPGCVIPGTVGVMSGEDGPGAVGRELEREDRVTGVHPCQSEQQESFTLCALGWSCQLSPCSPASAWRSKVPQEGLPCGLSHPFSFCQEGGHSPILSEQHVLCRAPWTTVRPEDELCWAVDETLSLWLGSTR